MIGWMRMLLTWWHNQTFGTALHTWVRGALVGQDTQGNRYYQDKGGVSINGKPRRWVIYNGDVEATRVPPEWHGWLHYTQDVPPNEAEFVHRAWHKPHRANLTGTKASYQPRRADAARGAPDGYHAWRPEETAKGKSDAQ